MLRVQQIHFAYLDKPTLSGIDFSVTPGTTLAVIGESGCGKSTLLKLIYGLYDLDQGAIYWNDTEVLGPKFNLIPGMEFMKYLAQDFDLMPFITVAENVGKYLSNIYKDKKDQRVAELLEIVEMSEFANVKAKYLSGGQMQRVALARVLALEPEVLLLDEPFSHIDNFRKNSLRRKLFAYLKEQQITTIVATHDSTDVLSFADEVLVMQNGTLLAQAAPKNLYQNPSNHYVASLFGDVNTITHDGKNLLLYPHQLVVDKNGAIPVTVTNAYYRGTNYLIEATHNGNLIYFENDTALEKGMEVRLNVKKG
ncbi:ABC transporter ATP-binding protein [Flavobacterium capsici]|uniref:ABC transporter ATP-binding protein n=1 Tax=Flavobacterium capsici TaxID=3075618 RepID=A0AA96J6L0_9FLAO|nr:MULTISPECIES: ABC transporter ATP-binding protein [unclassified Flavobacterium]WNM18973.1 ABC transporter ATP-binding protein [Flavobacterium sp. PMR2A8]WNM23023.1 ABC transporter ATP-binding protein [Flavobacterium sp. PMTSA4]